MFSELVSVHTCVCVCVCTHMCVCACVCVCACACACSPVDQVVDGGALGLAWWSVFSAADAVAVAPW